MKKHNTKRFDNYVLAYFAEEEYEALKRVIEREQASHRTIHAQALEASQTAKCQADWLMRICTLELQVANLKVQKGDLEIERRVGQRRKIDWFDWRSAKNVGRRKVGWYGGSLKE